jgi:hypothetical protein
VKAEDVRRPYVIQIHVQQGHEAVYWMDKNSRVAYHRLNSSKHEMSAELVQSRFERRLQKLSSGEDSSDWPSTPPELTPSARSCSWNTALQVSLAPPRQSIARVERLGARSCLDGEG